LDPSEFQENPARGVFVTTDIDNTLVNRLSPEIIKFRVESNAPICLYLDSLGGSVFHAQRLLDLIKTPTQRGYRCHMITVAVGFAASAAADLLALGDYAIAYPEAVIHYHGTRQSPDNLTLEDLSALESNLRETNERFALRLANRMFKRLVMRMITMSAEAPETLFNESLTNPASFFGMLKERLSQDEQGLIDKAIERQKKITKLVGFIDQSEGVQGQVKLLKQIIDFEVGESPGASQLTASKLEAIQDDFIQLDDFYNGRYRRNLEEIVLQEHAEELFLDENENEELKKIHGDEQRRAYLIEKVSPKLHPLYYLVVSLCRCLQQGEHSLTPTDAYWLGLVDEVLGSDLQCLRAIAEDIASEIPEEEKLSPEEQAAELTGSPVS
jgi:ATP-dependent protease ClpP protease subunit